MTRILILTSEYAPFRGGIGTYVKELAAAAHSAGHDVTVAAPDYHQDQAALDAGSPYRIIRYPGGVPDMRSLPGRILAARRIARSGAYDIVHAADWPFFIAARLLPRRHAPRRLLTFHGTEILYMQAPKRRKLLDLLGFWRKGWAEWISNSRYTHELALRTFPIAPEEARAVPLGVSQGWIDGRVDRDDARKAQEVGDRTIIVVSLGRVVPRKGHMVLADALALLPKTVAERIEWWVIGPLIDPAHAEALRARTATLAARVTFFGGLPENEVRQRLSAADIFCLPGYIDKGIVEGFGLVFLEAGAYGVPSIATRSGGIPEAVDDGVTGLLVPEQDAQALAIALDTLIADNDLRARMADAAFARAARSTWPAVMQATYG